MVKYLLQKFPELASIPNAAGRLPIEVALTSGRTWHSGIRELVQAHPNSLSQVDSILGLYPYQLVAQVGVTNSLDQDGNEPPRKKQWRQCQKVNNTKSAGPENSNAGEEESLHQLDTIFHLLRQCPSLVKFAGN